MNLGQVLRCNIESNWINLENIHRFKLDLIKYVAKTESNSRVDAVITRQPSETETETNQLYPHIFGS